MERSDLGLNSDLRRILEGRVAGHQSIEETCARLSEFPSGGNSVPSPMEVTDTGDVRLDTDRERRCGYPEVIYAPGKSLDAIQQAFALLISHQQNALATRCLPEQLAALQETFPDATANLLARTFRFNFESPQCDSPRCGRVVVISAGTSDRPVAEEALETLRWMHVSCELLLDVGVAGPQRFLREKHRLENADAIVVVAGMEGALPSVVGGWVDCPVFAVPTSVGYGAAFGGLTALLGMLNSCASNVAVVNIDAGFKAGYLAGMVAQRAHRVRSRNH